MAKRIYISILLVFLGFNLLSQKNKFFDNILENPKIVHIVESPEYEVQVIYTQINRNMKNNPSFKEYSHNNNKYIHPSMAVGLPMAILTFERINKLNNPKLDRGTPIKFGTGFNGYIPKNDNDTPIGYATMENYVQKMLVLHDSEAFNRCFDFLGQKYINDRIHSLGYKKAWILARYMDNENETTARYSAPWAFLKVDSITYYKDYLMAKEWPARLLPIEIYKQPMLYNNTDYCTLKKDAKCENSVYLSDVHEMVTDIFFDKKKFDLDQSDMDYIYRAMSVCKVDFMTNPSKNIRVFKNSGIGNGYVVQSAYYVDIETKTEFLLSVSVKCPLVKREYDYSFGKNFIMQLTALVIASENNRRKKSTPDFTSLKQYFANDAH